MFDLRKHRAIGGCGGGLERADRADVVAQPRPQSADRRVKTGEIGMPEREGGLVMLDRLAVGEAIFGPRTGQPEGLRGLGRSSTVALMRSDERQTSQVVAATPGEVAS